MMAVFERSREKLEMRDCDFSRIMQVNRGSEPAARIEADGMRELDQLRISGSEYWCAYAV